MSVFICGVPRCGSSLLAHLLHSTGVVGYPGEYFWRDDMRRFWDEWGVSTFGEYLERVFETGTAPNGVFAAKVMWGYFDDFMFHVRRLTREYDARDLEVIERVFPAPRFVWIRRDDAVAQGVSWAKAAQTGQWAAHQSATRDPTYDFEMIDGLTHMALVHNGAWRRWFAAEGVTPVEATYEELCADAVGTVRRVLASFGLEPSRDADIAPPPELQKQADGVNAEWIARYRRESIRADDTKEEPWPARR